MTPTLREIGAEFHRQQGHSLVISSGSTGKLYAQITHGAPYEVSLAADAQQPQRLEKEAYAVSRWPILACNKERRCACASSRAM